ncbi:MAG: GntR family transcriptional regulator [Alphaproteobacteria bacterium]|jgi:DNA-binding GntR family transcriptional regulator|nr:GntR family transcriptional regulator [Rhodospirillaceae bacterium]MDP6023586.1 GntR family transcriptional regulator [Alphaproteobacteria bacterium]MDP6253209.1 GntR family transcriptional regulator [Alphaproteobacteria bacterium]MDP7056731.1 GntR family transcriptional regulator [Alphaproteobacteria bacterium]MDP7228114.1 GntR family transcriptional regulator [Alphaproteobacteria bacterium]|tara:strand:+ start:577 stop:1248 length:672 start_codon:yes stop_codon:yes gene_type:complete
MLNGQGRLEKSGAVSLTDQAYGQLEELIVTVQLAPGDVLSEATLAARLGIGRTPIREALHRLAREGLVVILPRRGILVSDINVQSQLRLLEVRRKIEEVMVTAAAKRADQAERDEFRRIAEGMLACAAAGNDLAFIRFDDQFNHLVAAACRNEYAANAAALMAGLSRRFWFVHNRQSADVELAARRHADVAIAIADGDISGAEAASGRLMDYILDATKSSIDT